MGASYADVPVDRHAFDRHVIGLSAMLERVLVWHEPVASGFPDKAAARAAAFLVLDQHPQAIDKWLSMASPDDQRMLRGRSDAAFQGVRQDGMDVTAVMTHTIVVVLSKTMTSVGVSVRTAYPDARMHPEPSGADLSLALRGMDPWFAAELDQRWLWTLMCDPDVTVPMGTHADAGFVWVPLAPDGSGGMMRVGQAQTAFIDARGNVMCRCLPDVAPADAVVSKAFPKAYAVMRAAYRTLPIALDLSVMPERMSAPLAMPRDTAAVDAPSDDGDAMGAGPTDTGDDTAGRPADDGVRASRNRHYERQAERTRKSGAAKSKAKRKRERKRERRRAKDARSKPRPAAMIDHDPNFESQAHEAIYTAFACHIDVVSTADWRVLTLASSPPIVVSRQADKASVQRASCWLGAHADGFSVESGAIDTNDAFDAFDGLELEQVCDGDHLRRLAGRLAREGTWVPLLPKSMLRPWLDAHGWRPDLFQTVSF